MEHKERIYFWDNYKGVLIFLVVFGHYIGGNNQELVRILGDLIYVFHMPAFIFISGFFGKSEHSRSLDSILKLLTAYILFNGFFSIVFNGCSFAFNGYSFLVPFEIYWYIFSLIIWRASTPWVTKIKGSLLIFTIISILIGYSNEINQVLKLASIISFSPFYIAGYLLSSETAKNRIIHKSPKTIITGILAIELAIVIGLFAHYTIGFLREGLYSIGFTREDFFMWPYRFSDLYSGIGRFCIILISSLAIYGLGTFIPNRRIPLISRFGRNSLSIYLFHIFYLLFCKYVYISNEYLFILVAFLLSIATCIIFSSQFIVKFTNKLLAAGANVLKGSQTPEERVYYALVVRTLFWGILVLFLLHQPILKIIDYTLTTLE